MKSITCCFTGHREIACPEEELKDRTEDLVIKVIKSGFQHFITGGALGFDTIAAEVILELREELYPQITLEIAIPCLDQTMKWNKEQKARYDNILKRADKKTLISQTYNRYSMQLRNKYMVNNSAVVIAYFNNKPSGTKNTIEYAKKQKKEIWYI